MSTKRIDLGYRHKDYTAEVSIDHLPATMEQLSAAGQFLDLVKERDDLSIKIRIGDERYTAGVPREILLAGAETGIYMELTYVMEEEDRLVLASDRLSWDEAASVLSSILHDCTSENRILFTEFLDITSAIVE